MISIHRAKRSTYLFGLCWLAIVAMFGISSGEAQERQTGRLPSSTGAEPPHPPKVGERAPEMELKSASGEVVSLEQLTKNNNVVLLVLRGWPGYQCPICSRQVGQFLGKQTELSQAGADVVLVYPGPAAGLADHAKEFATRGKWNLPKSFHYVTDPDYTFTSAWGLRWEAARETAYPSTFIIDREHKIVFAATSDSHGGRTDVSQVLEVLERLQSKR